MGVGGEGGGHLYVERGKGLTIGYTECGRGGGGGKGGHLYVERPLVDLAPHDCEGWSPG